MGAQGLTCFKKIIIMWSINRFRRNSALYRNNKATEVLKELRRKTLTKPTEPTKRKEVRTEEEVNEL